MTKPEQVQEYYSEMLAESVHMNRMVNDLLELSRLQNPSYHIEKQRIDLMLVVKDAIRQQQHIAQNAGHMIKLDTQGNNRFPFYGDYGRLRQMLVTVLDNAIKFLRQENQSECRLILTPTTARSQSVTAVPASRQRICLMYLRNITCLLAKPIGREPALVWQLRSGLQTAMISARGYVTTW